MTFSLFFLSPISFQIAYRKVPCETAYLKIPGWKRSRFVPLNSWQDISQQQTPPPTPFVWLLPGLGEKKLQLEKHRRFTNNRNPVLPLSVPLNLKIAPHFFFPPVTSPPTQISSLIRRTFWGHSYTQQNYLPRMSPLPCQSSASETYWLTTQTYSPMVPSQTYCHSLTSLFLKARTNLINRIEEDHFGCMLEHF